VTAHSEDLVILACTVLIGLQTAECDGQRRTDGRLYELRAKHYVLSRVKMSWHSAVGSVVEWHSAVSVSALRC